MFVVEKYLGEDYIVMAVVSVKQELSGLETETFVFVQKDFCSEVTAIEVPISI